MSRCELTGKSPVVRNRVSHSNIKTKATAFPNVQKKRLFSKTLNQFVTLQIATSALRDMEHMGGFDVFVLRQNPEHLSVRALTARARILRKLKAKKTAGAGQAGGTPVPAEASTAAKSTTKNTKPSAVKAKAAKASKK